MKVKTSELEGVMLDYAVAQCEGVSLGSFLSARQYSEHAYQYSTGWFQAGPIIEREKIGVWWATHYVDGDGVEYGNHWYSEPACTDDNADKPYRVAVGPTLLIAAMRCYVVNNLGDEVEVPEDLLTGVNQNESEATQ